MSFIVILLVLIASYSHSIQDAFVEKTNRQTSWPNLSGPHPLHPLDFLTFHPFQTQQIFNITHCQPARPPKLLGRGIRCRFTKVPCLMPEFSIFGSLGFGTNPRPRLDGETRVGWGIWHAIGGVSWGMICEWETNREVSELRWDVFFAHCQLRRWEELKLCQPTISHTS